jgi:hypothetical protein
MQHVRRKNVSHTDALFKTRPRKTVPHAFVLDALEPAAVDTRPMFGSLAIYVRDKIVMVLRDRKNDPDNGVWVATTEEHHASLRREFPTMRSISAFGETVTGWQVLPADADDFEEAALHACELVVHGDPRIGKVPKPRPSRAKNTAARRRRTP